MSIYKEIINREESISLIGLGYVGMPIAVAFAKKVKVIGFDVNDKKINLYRNGIDPTKEVGEEAIKETTIEFTSDEKKLKEAKFHIVAVPTPIKDDKTPDLRAVKAASKTVGKNLQKGSYVVYESTVYPGVTEDICIPILEEESGLKVGKDFKVGYSPERINPGDKVHRLENIVKVVSGIDEEALENIAKVYEIVVEAGVHKAQSIKVAEAAKVIENSQRDINIAFMNELSIIFNKLEIDTKAVLEAANTKWNFLNFSPGLVGGHCIGIDPYYLTYKAEQVGYHSQIILAGREINDDMGKYVASQIVKKMIKNDIKIKGSKVALFGLTFKENTPDIRNTRIVDVIEGLEEYGIEVLVTDPLADKEESKKEYDIDLLDINEIKGMDAIVVAVPHEDYKSIKLEELSDLYSHIDNKVLIDIKGIYSIEEAKENSYKYWRL